MSRRLLLRRIIDVNQTHTRVAAAMCALIYEFAGYSSAQARCAAPHIIQNMGYSQAKRIINAAGFQAPTLPAYGYKKDDQKVISDCFNSIEVCNRFPEIDSCSGQGQCVMMFTDPYGNVLHVYTYGELEKKGAAVTGFYMECKK